MIQLPSIKHPASGLRKVGNGWYVIYYVNGKVRSRRTGESDIKRAAAKRDEFYAEKVKAGAVYAGSAPHSKPVLARAIRDPKSMACVYKVTYYRVIVDGVTVTTTANKKNAIKRRNEYIKHHYKK